MQNTIKFVIAIIIAVVSTTAWMDNRFITTLEAKEFASVQQVSKLERIITFQQLQMVWKDIENEEKKQILEQSKTKLEIFYKEEDRLKKELEVK